MTNPLIRFKVNDKYEKYIKESIDKICDVPIEEKLKLVMIDQIIDD